MGIADKIIYAHSLVGIMSKLGRSRTGDSKGNSAFKCAGVRAATNGYTLRFLTGILLVHTA